MNFCPCLLQEAPEYESAKEMFGGRLIPDVLTEKLGLTNCGDVTCLTLHSFSIRQCHQRHEHDIHWLLCERINRLNKCF